jgi:hypothetical protein
MPEVRYQVPGVPAGPAAGLTAFLPHFNRAAAGGAQSYKYGIFGGPAAYHPAPTTDTAPSPDVGDLALAGTSRSSDCPDGWWIDDYNLTGARYERPGAGMPIQFYSPTQPGLTTLLPIPAENVALNARANSAKLARTTLLNRVRQLPWYPRTWVTPNAGG